MTRAVLGNKNILVLCIKKAALIALPFILFSSVVTAKVPKWVYNVATTNTTSSYVALHYLLRQNCTRYINASQGLWNINTLHSSQNCQRLATDVLHWLDYLMITKADNSNIALSFHSELFLLLQQAKVAFALEKLKSDLKFYKLKIKDQPVIYESLFSVLNDELLTYKVLAFLFQDTSLAGVHLKWINEQYAQQFNHHPELNNTFQTLVYLNQQIYEMQKSSELLIYSQLDVPSHKITSGIYHMYVPSYLTAQAIKSGYSDKYSYLAGFLLNFIYEKLSSQNTFTAVTSPHAPITDKSSRIDICMGHVGSLKALKYQNIDFKWCLESLQNSASEFVVETLKNL